MMLPRLMLITEQPLMQPDSETALRAALLGGARLIQLREKALPASGVLRLARRAQQLCEEFGAHLIVNSELETAQNSGAFGAHLPQSKSVLQAREFLGVEYSVGQSVHSLESAMKAQNDGADYLVFGSVFATESHIGSTPAGVRALKKIAREVSIPIFAVGGMTAQNARECVDAGAHGVAVIRAVWSAPDVAEAVRELLKVLET